MEFPWPDSALCGNSRKDRRFITPIRRAARESGYTLARAAGLVLPSAPLRLALVLHAPNRRRWDDANVFYGFKAFQDGIFDFLGLDDRLIVETLIQRGERVLGGRIDVTLTEIQVQAGPGKPRRGVSGRK